MNWIKENKFLTAFFGVMLVVTAALAFLLVSSKDHFDEVQSEYASVSTELSRLQNLPLYPSEDHLKEMLAQKNEYVEASTHLQESLEALQIPLEPIRPEEFQDQLKKTVDDTVARTGSGGLPSGFYFGFENYKSSPPKGDAAAPLSRELKAIEWIVDTLLEARVHSITEIHRMLLPEEIAETKNTKTPVSKPGDAPNSGVRKNSFEISFTAEQSRVRMALNAIVNSKKQFYIIRSLLVKNEKMTGPLRELPSVGAPVDPSQKLQLIAGNEKLNVTAKIEIVDFTVKK